MRGGGESQFESRVREERETSTSSSSKSFLSPTRSRTFSDKPRPCPIGPKEGKSRPTLSRVQSRAYPHTTPIKPSSPFLPSSLPSPQPPSDSPTNPNSTQPNLLQWFLKTIIKKKVWKTQTKFCIFHPFTHPFVLPPIRVHLASVLLPLGSALSTPPLVRPKLFSKCLRYTRKDTRWISLSGTKPL